MKEKFNYKLFSVCLLGMVIGRLFSRLLSEYFGVDGHSIITTISFGVLFCVIIYLVIIKKYIVSVIFLYMCISPAVAGIGVLLDNRSLIGLGILLLFIMYAPLIIIAPKLKK